MKKKIKKFLKDNALGIVTIVIVAMWLWFFYMVFGFIWEIAQFHKVMNAIAG